MIFNLLYQAPHPDPVKHTTKDPVVMMADISSVYRSIKTVDASQWWLVHCRGVGTGVGPPPSKNDFGDTRKRKKRKTFFKI